MRTRSIAAKVDLETAPLRDCISYYNGEGNAAPGSLAYYGGGIPAQWHKGGDSSRGHRPGADARPRSIRARSLDAVRSARGRSPMDPVSLIVSALALGANAGIKEAFSEAGKDAYNKLTASVCATAWLAT
jgi:hypothetical protein